MKQPWFFVTLALLSGLLTGCGDNKPATQVPAVAHKHEHKPPHGGTPVELGQEEYHVELVLDPASSKLQAYVMDGELENFVRVGAPALEIEARLPDRSEALVLKAVPNTATGETVGDTSLFETQAEWLKKVATFDAVLKELTVKGKSYQNVTFNFPKGNDKDEKAN